MIFVDSDHLGDEAQKSNDLLVLLRDEHVRAQVPIGTGSDLLSLSFALDEQ